MRERSCCGAFARDERELEQGYKLVRTAYRVLPDRQEKSFAYRVPANAGE